MVTGVIGHNNVSSYSLEDLTKDTGYCRIKIANKIVNYGTDISMQSLKNDTFTVLASGELIPAREIYRSNFEMRDYAKLIFNVNKMDGLVGFLLPYHSDSRKIKPTRNSPSWH